MSQTTQPKTPRCVICLLPDDRGNPLAQIKVDRYLCRSCTRMANGQHVRRRNRYPEMYDAVHGDGVA